VLGVAFWLFVGVFGFVMFVVFVVMVGGVCFVVADLCGLIFLWGALRVGCVWFCVGWFGVGLALFGVCLWALWFCGVFVWSGCVACVFFVLGFGCKLAGVGFFCCFGLLCWVVVVVLA